MPSPRICTVARDWLRRCLLGTVWTLSATLAGVPAARAQLGSRHPFNYSNLDAIDIALVLAVIGALAGLIVYFTPTKRIGVPDGDHRFWHELQGQGGPFLGVLYEDAGVHNTSWVINWYNVRRISVTLKHEDPALDESIYSEDKVQTFWDLFQRIDRAAALACWLETAQRRGLPAVYRQKGELQVLTPNQMQAALSDPAAFSAAFLKHLLRGKPLPEGRIGEAS